MNVDKQDDDGGLRDIAGNNLGANDYNIVKGARITRWMIDLENSLLTLIFASSMKADAPSTLLPWVFTLRRVTKVCGWIRITQLWSLS